ncbi:hypothetical protein PsorP6_009713 [Peronosclerospora sorghi]|uniref:Uncharacterized protein n=1 Tax=Peronosclerospora sorghi TaxID=230839 RepID=A0ACC0W1Y3_9STRA|nr:hypothetical protein PsorP6_009713 [Peronosclerospora sorghi]
MDPAYLMESSLLTEPSHPTDPAEETTTATGTTLPTAPPRLRRAMPPKKTPAFNPSYVEKYGLRISARRPQAQKVVSVECRFCAAFGRECKIGAKRKATCNVKFFTSFQADQIKGSLGEPTPE